MKKMCKTFREQLSAQLTEGSVESILKQATHPKECQACHSYMEEFIVTREFLADAKVSDIQDPDFHFMRKKIWDAIDEKEAGPAFFPARVFTPALTTLLAVLVIGVSILYFGQPSIEQGYTDVSAELDELFATETISEDVIVDAVYETDLSDEILTYFVDRSAYNVLQEVYSNREEWEDIAAELAAMEL
ncbi:MAG: hypothetical protein GF372_00690 [Candidatus Marinimicrobia bacterium]|nr:hypothetical protein [Candidatus Neomarinimicrobiota bacterium]